MGEWIDGETQLLISWSFSSVQFNRSVMSNSLQPHGQQHARPPCPLPTPRVYSNSIPLSRWCHRTTSSSVVSFSGVLQFMGSQRVGHDWVTELNWTEVCHSFSSKEQVSFNFMAAVTICSDFGAPQNKVPHCFHCFPIYLSWSDGTRCHDLSFLNVPPQ